MHLYVLLLISAGGFFALVFASDPDSNRSIVMYLVAANIFIMGLLAIFSQILQATNQLKRYGIFNSADKVFFIFLLPLIAISSLNSYLFLALADITAKLILLIYIVVLHKEFLIGSVTDFKKALSEFFENIKCGSKLMLANVSGMLVLGTGRFVIEYFDSVENYAYYAFGVSMTNLALVATTALSIVIYPTLKRLPESNYLNYYNITSRRLLAFNCLLLFVYFPAVVFIKQAMPSYTPVIPYLNFLFAITILQGKMQLLNNTYYKAMRRESSMLTANLSSVFIAVLFSGIAYAATGKIESIAIAALVTMIYRVFASEWYLRKQMKDQSRSWGWLELLTLLAFIAPTSTLPLPLAAIITSTLLGIILYHLRSDLNGIFAILLGRIR